MAADSSGIFVGGNFASVERDAGPLPDRQGGQRRQPRPVELHLRAHLGRPRPNTAKSVRAMDLANGRVFASWGESVNKTVIYNQATAAFVSQLGQRRRHAGRPGQRGQRLRRRPLVPLHGSELNSAAVYFAAFDAASLAKETVVAPIPTGRPLGVFAIIPDGSGGLWLGGDVGGLWGPSAVKVRRARPPDVRIEPAPADHHDDRRDHHDDHDDHDHHARDDHHDGAAGRQRRTRFPGESRRPSGRPWARPTPSPARPPTTHPSPGCAWPFATPRPSSGCRPTAASGRPSPSSTPRCRSRTLPARVGRGRGELPAGSYYVQSKAVDNTTTNETATPWVAFSVSPDALRGGDQPSPRSAGGGRLGAELALGPAGSRPG